MRSAWHEIGCRAVVGIVAAAALDNRLSWGTVASVLVALYCHRLYRRPPTEVVVMRSRPPEDGLRPGWAARWGSDTSVGQRGQVCSANPAGRVRAVRQQRSVR